MEAKIIFAATDTSMSPSIRIRIMPSTSGHTSIPDWMIDWIVPPAKYRFGLLTISTTLIRMRM